MKQVRWATSFLAAASLWGQYISAQQQNCTRIGTSDFANSTNCKSFGVGQFSQTHHYTAECYQTNTSGTDIDNGPASPSSTDLTGTGVCLSAHTVDVCDPVSQYIGNQQYAQWSLQSYTLVWQPTNPPTPTCVPSGLDISDQLNCAPTSGTCGGGCSGPPPKGGCSCDNGIWDCPVCDPNTEPTCANGATPVCNLDGTWTCPGCVGSPENYSCECQPPNWVCECPGPQPTCPDGSLKECSGGEWICPTVSSCVGSPFECWDGSESQCVNSEWVCPPPPDPCDPIFSPPEGCDGAGASCDQGSWCQMCGYC